MSSQPRSVADSMVQCHPGCKTTVKTHSAPPSPTPLLLPSKLNITCIFPTPHNSMTSSLIGVGKVCESQLQFAILFIFKLWNSSSLFFFFFAPHRQICPGARFHNQKRLGKLSLPEHWASSKKQRDSTVCNITHLHVAHAPGRLFT